MTDMTALLAVDTTTFALTGEIPGIEELGALVGLDKGDSLVFHLGDNLSGPMDEFQGWVAALESVDDIDDDGASGVVILGGTPKMFALEWAGTDGPTIRISDFSNELVLA